MSGKTLSPAEAVVHLTQRPATGAAPSARRRASAADAPNAGTVRPSGNRGGAVVWLHKFRVGQTVTLVPNRYGANRLGGFKVTCLLPQEHGVNQYRLKSTTNGHERVAGESELT